MNVYKEYAIMKTLLQIHFGGDFTKKISKITFILAVAAEVICCLVLNTLGGAAFIMNGYDKCGFALFASTVLLVAALILIKFKKSLVPLILTIIGSACYIYTLAVIEAIPNTKIPKEYTEALSAKHFPTISVTVLLILLVIFNFFSEEAVQKRMEKRERARAEKERSLNDDERIL